MKRRRQPEGLARLLWGKRGDGGSARTVFSLFSALLAISLYLEIVKWARYRGPATAERRVVLTVASGVEVSAAAVVMSSTPTSAYTAGSLEETIASSLPVPVLWMAPFFDNSGFGKEAATLVLSLIRCGGWTWAAWAACTVIATLVISLIRCGNGGQGTWGEITSWGANLYRYTMQEAHNQGGIGKVGEVGWP